MLVQNRNSQQEPLKIATLYFKLSNESDFNSIEKLFTETTTYSSENTGIYLGQNSIIEMQREFHGKFLSLKWHVNLIEEVKSGVVLVSFDFVGKTLNGEKIESSGVEYVIVYQGKIQHIQICSRTLGTNRNSFKK